MIDDIIFDITKNISDALNKSLNPLIEKIKSSDENVKILNKILYEMPLYQELEKKYFELKFKYDDLVSEKKRLHKIIESTKNIIISVKNKDNHEQSIVKDDKLFSKLSNENIVINNEKVTGDKEIAMEEDVVNKEHVDDEEEEVTDDEEGEVTDDEEEEEEVTDDEEEEVEVTDDEEEDVINKKKVDDKVTNKKEEVTKVVKEEEPKVVKEEVTKVVKEEEPKVLKEEPKVVKEEEPKVVKEDTDDEYEEVTDDEYEEVTDDENDN